MGFCGSVPWDFVGVSRLPWDFGGASRGIWRECIGNIERYNILGKSEKIKRMLNP